MAVESIVVTPTDTDDLIGDFFRLVEAPVAVEEPVSKDESHGYFAETLSWLEEVDSPTSIKSMELIYQIQDMAITQQLLCSCVAHSSILENPSSFSTYSYSYEPSFSLVEMTPLGADSHAGHEHCNCGGHYKDGKCESCGSLKDND